MLRTEYQDTHVFITQPDHGRLAGMLASHWGNASFAAAGHYGNPNEKDVLRSEVLLGIAEHDNGWWEWEADPTTNADTGLPLGLGEMAEDPQAGMQRWHMGAERLPRHPYASLLIAWHAYWLYGFRVLDTPDLCLLHPIYWKKVPTQLQAGAIDLPKEFMNQLSKTMRRYELACLTDESRSCWLSDEVLKPNVRLLQISDALSLALCSALLPAAGSTTIGLGNDDFTLNAVPRSGWDDLVDIQVTALGNNRLRFDPFPFGSPELTVTVPAKVLPVSKVRDDSLHSWWHSEAQTILSWTLTCP